MNGKWMKINKLNKARINKNINKSKSKYLLIQEKNYSINQGKNLYK